MADLLVQTRPHLGTAKPKASVRSTSKTITKNPQAAGVIGTVHKAIKEANTAWLSWKDGLTEYEREQTRLLEERRKVLCSRMKTVCTTSFSRLEN